MIRARTCLVVAGATLWAAAVAFAQPVQTQQPGGIKIGNTDYQKLGTREATERRMLELLRPGRPKWGDWYILTPFPYDMDRGPHLADAGPPEDELAKMAAGGSGPDLQRQYAGKGGKQIRWQPVGNAANTEIKLDVYDDAALNEFAAGYVYSTVRVDKPTTLDVTMGSDDGLRFWLNGRLLVDADVLRGLDPEDHKVRLDLKAGVNHVLAKISQVRGGFEYEMITDPPLDAYTSAQLDYQLNLDFPKSDEDRYFRAYTVVTPPDVVLEVGGLDVLPANKAGECRPIVCTRRGDVYIVEGAYETPPLHATFKRFASGLHEPLGLAVRQENGPDGRPRTAVYCVQRGELTRLLDTDGDEVADVYETVCDAWGVSGNYHEFAFGPKFDREGNAWVTLNVGFCGGLGKSLVPLRGCGIKVDPRSGRATRICDGLRSPNGIGEYSDGAMFYLDNQGDYVGTNRMSLMAPGAWAGHPSSLHWRDGWSEGQETPPLQPAAIWLPYKKMGQSGADFLLCAPGSQNPAINRAIAEAKFGPFAGQIFVGDQTLCIVSRICLERVDGVYQGAAFPFRSGLDCGVNRLCWGGDGSMFVGQTDRGWGSIGRLRYGLQRIAWTGQTPFEVQTMRVTPDGFELRFTGDLDLSSAGSAAAYAMTSYTYEYHAEYGSPETDSQTQTITKADIVDARTVRLHVNRLRAGGMGYVHELTLPGVKSADGRGVLHPFAYYTVQKIPSGTNGAENTSDGSQSGRE